VGGLHFFSMTESGYPRHQVDLAESVAGQIAGTIASSLLREVEQQTAKENAVLAEIGRTITSATDVRDVFEPFGELVGQILPFNRLVITLFDSKAGTATGAYAYGWEVPGWGDGTVHEIAGTSIETIQKTRKTLYAPDISKDVNEPAATRRLLTGAGFNSSLLAPLWSNGELIGCLNIKHSEIGAYTPRSIELAERIADQIAGAIANARLYEDLRHVADERRALAAIALAATQNLDLDGVFARAADSLKKMVDYDRMSITLLDQDDESLRVAFTRGQRLLGFRIGDIVEPVSGDPFDGEHWTWKSGLGLISRPDGRIQTTVQVPLGSHPRLLGYIWLRSNAADAYDERSIDKMERVATYLTPAVQNALEHDREMRLAQERERSLILGHENRELQRLNEAKSRFLTTVTHELKTPLTSITAFTNILLKNRVGGMTERDLSQLVVIQRNNRRLKNLIDDLLDLSQIDQGGLSLTMSEFNAGEMLTEVLDGFRPITDAKSQEIISSFPSRPVSIRADRDRLAQIMTNLLSNASKYSPNGAEIGVSARRWKDRLYFSVTDHGIGISDEDRKSLFTLFFRADNVETRAIPGTGIGLYIAKTIIDLHGGRIEVRPPTGDGTTMGFYVPGAHNIAIDAEQHPETLAAIIPWSRMDELPEEQEEATG
jgi:signal transduction histidine kinase